MDKKPRIAIFICGPFRYADLVANQLERLFKTYDYDCFYHIWVADLGNKRRINERNNYEYVRNHRKTKIMITGAPYSESFYQSRVQTKSNGSSLVSSHMGMFFSVSMLCNYLQQIPDFEEYTHILRLRTDCSILSENFEKKLVMDTNTITDARNFLSSDHYPSDHITFAPIEIFFRIWKFDSMEDIYKIYKSGCGNTDQSLSVRFALIEDSTKLNKALWRYRDYQIVYDPPQRKDPDWVKKLVKSGEVVQIFLNPSKHLNLFETVRHILLLNIVILSKRFIYSRLENLKVIIRSHFNFKN